MDIRLDSANVKAVQKVKRLGLLAGVTTNPTLIAQQKLGCDEALRALLHHQEGPVTAQVCANQTAERVQQGQAFYEISNRLIIKVPLTKEGLEAIHLLSRQGIPTMATVIFHPHQALVAALAGAQYVAPYLGAIEKVGHNPWDVLQNMVKIFHNYRLKTKILGASLLTTDYLLKCAEAGIYGVTLKEELFDKFIESDPLTLQRNALFATDWSQINQNLFVS